MRVNVLFLLIAAVILPTPAWATPVAVGSEFQVNHSTAGDQGLPSVAADRVGRFVVVWQDAGRDGSGLGVFGRRFDGAGAALGGDFRVNQFSTGDQRKPSIAMDGSGNFVVLWESNGQDGSGTGIFGRWFYSDGTPGTNEFQVNARTTNDQFTPVVAMNDAGEFVAVWGSTGQDLSGFGVVGRRYDPYGVPTSGEFLVNTHTPSWQSDGAVALNESGEFVVVWRSYNQDGSGYGVFGQRFDRVGLPEGEEFQVNVYTSGNQYCPAVMMDDSGNVAVVWQSEGQDGSGATVCARAFDAYGFATPEVMTHQHTAGNQSLPRISMGSDDNFMIVWQSQSQDGSDLGIFAQNWDVPGPEFRVNAYTTGAQSEPDVTVSASGDIVVVWQSAGQDGSGTGIYARRYTCYNMDGDAVCDFADIILTEPQDGALVSCDDPRTTRPTIQWDPGYYDGFRVVLSADPTFTDARARVTSGDTLLKSTSWTPSAKKWRNACIKALTADPFTPEIYVRVEGVDRDLPKRMPDRKTYSQVVEVDVMH